MKILTVLILSLLLSACSFDELADGYQFGDIIKMTNREYAEFLQHRKTYCNVAQQSVIREAALRILQLNYPWIPAEGICTQLPTLIISDQS